VADARREIRAAFDAVVSARSIEALRDGG
jgi:hypothetical protein